MEEAQSMPTTLGEFFPVYRSVHRVPDERVDLTLVGVPQGATRRRMQRTLLAVAVLGGGGAVVGASTGTFLATASATPSQTDFQ